MKRFTKIMLIGAAICFVLGTGITMAAAAMGGSPSGIRQRIRNQNDYSRRIVVESVEAVPIEAVPEAADSNAVDSNAAGAGAAADDWDSRGALEKKELDITVQAGVIRILQEKDLASVEIRNLSRHMNLEKKIDEDSVELEFSKKPGVHHWIDRNHIAAVVVIPEDHDFQKISLEVDAGAIQADALVTDTLELDMGAGVAEFQDIAAKQVMMECSAGAVTFQGQVQNLLDVEVDAGAVEVKLPGTMEDYNYKLDVNAGGISIADQEFNGMSQEKLLQHEGAEIEIRLQCNAGGIEVDFEE